MFLGYFNIINSNYIYQYIYYSTRNYDSNNYYLPEPLVHGLILHDNPDRLS